MGTGWKHIQEWWRGRGLRAWEDLVVTLKMEYVFKYCRQTGSRYYPPAIPEFHHCKHFWRDGAVDQWDNLQRQFVLAAPGAFVFDDVKSGSQSGPVAP